MAQQIDLRIECASGIRPVRVISREADISDRSVRLRLNHIYSEQEKYVLLEVETPSRLVGTPLELAKVMISYENVATQTRDELSQNVAARYVATDKEMEAAINNDVLLAAVTEIAMETNRKAVTLRNQGQVEEAKAFLKYNVDYLGLQKKRFKGNATFDSVAGENHWGYVTIDQDDTWWSKRKRMRATQNQFSN